MLTIQEPQLFLGKLDLPAPDVYIHSAEVDNSGINIYFSIEDNLNDWLVNDQVLENIFVYIYCNDELYTQSLSSIKKNNLILDGKVYSKVYFKTDSYDITIRAYCGNDKVVGNEVSEKILSLNSLATSSYNDTSFKYINKNKDLRLLDIENNLQSFEINENIQEICSNLYISHTTNKQAIFGFIFDLEKFLIDNSKSYRVLKNNNLYRENILNNSYIDSGSIKLFKKNITNTDSDYTLINFNPSIIRMQDGIDENKYLINSSDDGVDSSNYNSYSIKVRINIVDNSRKYLGEEIYNNIENIKTFIVKYKEIFETIERDNTIKNKKNYIFENFYEKNLQDIKKTVQVLSDVFAFYNAKDINQYFSLFLTIFHPLTSNILLFDKILYNINIIQNYVKNLLGDTKDTNDITNIYNKNIHIFEHEFKYIDLDDRNEYVLIDYNYDKNYGYEVISMESKEIRYPEKVQGLKILTPEDKAARKLYESTKYFGSPNADIYNKINHLSISYIDIGDNSYDLLTGVVTNDVDKYNEIFVRMNELNNFNFSYNTLESYYFQLLGKNVYIKSIASRNNTSVNNLQKTTIFDPNLDSKQKSLKYISDTGINSLYYILDNNQYISVPSNIYQYQATLETNAEIPGVLPVSKDTLNNPEMKPTLIGYYNTFFEDKIVYSGQNYELWSVEPAVLNDLFKKKLKLFNQYYILEKKKTVPQQIQQIIEYPFENELNYNIPTKYLNRTLVPYKVLISTEEI